MYKAIKLIGKNIADNIGLTEFLGGATYAETVHITTKINKEQLTELYKEIRKCNTTVQIDTVVREQGLDKIAGLSEYLKELYSTGNLYKLNINGVNKFAISQRYVDIAEQAKGFTGVNTAINEYNNLTEESEKLKFAETIKASNSSLGQYLIGLKCGTASLKEYAGSLVVASAKTMALETATTALNAIVSMGVSAVIGGITYMIQSLIESDERYLEEQQNIIDEANESIEKYDQEIKSLENLQDKLIATNGNKSELAKLSGELNDIIGKTPGLLTDEGLAYDIANQKLATRIELLKKEREEKVKDKVNAAKNTYDANLLENNWGFDKNIDVFRKYMDVYEIYKKIADGDLKKVEIDPQATAKERFDIFKNAYGKDVADNIAEKIRLGISVKKGATPAEIWKAIFDDSIEYFWGATPNASEIEQYFREQLETAHEMFDEYLSDVDEGALVGITADNLLADMVYAAYKPEEMRKVFQALANDSELESAVTDFYKGMSEGADASILFKNLEDAFNDAYKKHPEVKDSLKNWYDSIIGSKKKEADNSFEAQYQRTINSAKKKFSTDTKFDWDSWFKEHSIDTREEIDRWNQIAEAADTAEGARENYLKPIPLSDTLSESKDSIDKFQSAVKSASEAYTTLMSGNYSSTDLLDSIQAINQAAVDMGNNTIDWESILTSADPLQAIEEAIESVSQTYADSILSGAKDSGFGKMLANIVQESYKSEAALSSLNTQIDSLQSAYNSLTDIVDTYNETGYITFDQLQTLLAMEPQYLSCLLDESGQLQLNGQAMMTLANQRLDDAEAQAVQQAITELGQLALQGEQAAVENNATAFSNAVGSLSQYNEALAVVIGNAGVGTAIINDLNSAISGAEAEGASDTQINTVLDNLTTKMNLIENVRGNIGKSLGNFDTIMGGNSSNSTSSSNSTQNSKTSKQIDFFEYRITELDQAISKVEAHMNNFTGSAAKNLSIDSLVKLNTTKQSDLQKSLALYTHMAEQELAKIPEQFHDMAKNGALNITDFIGDGNGDIAEAIESYRKWADKVDETTNSIEELSSTLKQLQLDKFTNIADDYTKLLDQITQSTDKLNTLIDTQEKVGGVVSRRFYEELITQTKIQIDYLQKEKQSLEQQMSQAIANGIQIGSDEWAEMESALEGIDTEIIKCTGSIEDFNDAIRNIEVENLNKVMDAFSDITDEIDSILSLAENDVVVDDNGKYTESAVTQMGLISQQYIIAERRAQECQDAIDKLDQAYKNGEINLTEYTELHRELTGSYWDAKQASQDAKQAIFEYHKKAVEKEIENIEKARDAYKEYIDAKKEALDKESDNHDFQKDLAENRKEATSLMNQIAQLTGNDDYTIARREELQQKLNDVNEEYNEMLYDRSIEQQKEALDKEYEEYSDNCDREIEKREESMEETSENVQRIFTETMDFVSKNSEMYLNGMAAMCDEFGIKVSNDLTEPWQNGQNALGMYNGNLNYHTGAFNLMLDGVKQHIYDDGVEADTTAQKLMNTFNVKADNLEGELSQVWLGLNSDIGMADSLCGQINSLFNDYGAGYLVGQLYSVAEAIDSIASSAQNTMSNIASSAKSAAHDISESTQLIYDAGMTGFNIGKAVLDQWQSNNEKHGYRIVDRFGNVLQEFDTTEYEAAQQAFRRAQIENKLDPRLEKFAKGGVVTTKNQDPVITKLANSIGEDTFIAVKEGERILTPEQNKNFEKIANADTKDNGTSIINGNEYRPISIEEAIAKRSSLPLEEFKARHAEFITSLPDLNLQPPTYDYKSQAPTATTDRNIDNSINFNSPLMEIKGNIGDAEIKKFGKIVDKKIYNLKKEQSVAIRTYMGRS